MVYVNNEYSGSVSVIDETPLNHVVATIPVGTDPEGGAVDPATETIYVTNNGSDSLSVLDGAPASPAFNTVTATVNLGSRVMDPDSVAVQWPPTTST
jgi:YVTN family beta-propeller protein